MLFMNSLSDTTSQYMLSNVNKSYEKDGQQTLLLSCIAGTRTYKLLGQLEDIIGKKSILAIVTFTAVSLFDVYSKNYIRVHELAGDSKNKLVRYLKVFSDSFYKLMQNSDTILNLACCVSYVALIAFKQTTAGIMGLASLLLIALKRNRLLPHQLDNALSILAHLAGFLSAVASTEGLLYRTFIGLLQIDSLIDTVNHTSYGFDICKNPYKQVFKRPKHNKDPQQDLEEFKTFLSSEQPFKVNQTYHYAKEVSQVLPLDSLKSLDNVSTEDLFNSLEAKIKTEKIELTEDQQEGLQKIRTGAITGRVEDTLPSNADLFLDIMKALTYSILNDKVNFETNVYELCEIGNHCVEGWTREVSIMLNPDSKEIGWSVHLILSKMRGGIIPEFIQENEKLKKLMSNYGGANNIHLQNVIQSLASHRTRSYQGELCRHLEPLNLFYALIMRYFLSDVSKINLADEALFFNMIMGLTFFNFSKWFNQDDILELKEMMAEHMRSPDLIIDAVYEAIKPQHPVGKDGKLDTRRDIGWEAVQAWQSSFLERYDFTVEDPWVLQDLGGCSYLSRDGVKLLLWDLGILDIH